MIVRTWRGWTSLEQAAAYVEYVTETGIASYLQTAGNRGAWILRRDEADRCEIVTVSLWDSMEAIRAFAGDQPERAVFYPEDDLFLVGRDEFVTHHTLVVAAGELDTGVGPAPTSERRP